jgi:hypothetical protein
LMIFDNSTFQIWNGYETNQSYDGASRIQSFSG